jgi:8-oxo-dGTP pyrophosphatase MutT (NUDIX family)
MPRARVEGLTPRPSAGAVFELEDLVDPAPAPDRTSEYLLRDLHAEEIWEPATEHTSYGGVVFGPDGRVLLRRPADDFGDYHWTFAKGGAEEGEAPTAAALREQGEETGVVARVVGHLPGGFSTRHTHVWTDGDGHTQEEERGTVTHFLLFEDTGLRRPDLLNGETEDLAWATYEEAQALIAETAEERGRLRDLAVLDAAFESRNELGWGRPALREATPLPSRAQLRSSIAAADAARGPKVGDMLSGALATPSGVSYLGTARGRRRRLTSDGTARFALDRIAAGSLTVLARGDLGDGRRWYLEAPCTSPGCEEHAYLRVHGENRWYSTNDEERGVEARRKVFRAGLDAAKRKVEKAQCGMHRQPRPQAAAEKANSAALSLG